MKILGALASPYVARVVMFANLKGIEIPMEPAPGDMGSDEYNAINPIGKIPSLVVDGQCIAESEVICEYLESVYPDPALIPADPMQQAQSRMISRITDFYVAPHNTPLTRMRSRKVPPPTAGSEVNTTSLAAAACCGVSANAAPASIRFRAASRRASHTVRSKPESRI